jgi:hypothetical protein
MRRKLPFLLLFVLVACSFVVVKQFDSHATVSSARLATRSESEFRHGTHVPHPSELPAQVKSPEKVTTTEYVETLKEISLQAPPVPQAPVIDLAIPWAATTSPATELPPPAVIANEAVDPPAPQAPLVPTPPLDRVVAKKPVNLWSIHIEQHDGKDVVRAAIGKKNGIRIACDRVNLQTANDFFQAQGNVLLAGDNLECRCEKLTIRLNEDCLFLEGKAQVGLMRPSAASASQPLLVELKGEQFSLRWPDLRVEASAPQPPAVEVLTEPKVVGPDTPKTSE